MIENLIIEKTITSPYVNFDASTGIFQIVGRSIDVDSSRFYSHLYYWICKYLDNPLNDITFKFKFEYINADSPKLILSLLNYAAYKAKEKGIKCSIYWYCYKDDISMLELGETLEGLLKIPFEILPQT